MNVNYIEEGGRNLIWSSILSFIWRVWKKQRNKLSEEPSSGRYLKPNRVVASQPNVFIGIEVLITGQAGMLLW